MSSKILSPGRFISEVSQASSLPSSAVSGRRTSPRLTGSDAVGRRKVPLADQLRPELGVFHVRGRQGRRCSPGRGRAVLLGQVDARVDALPVNGRLELMTPFFCCWPLSCYCRPPNQSGCMVVAASKCNFINVYGWGTPSRKRASFASAHRQKDAHHTLIWIHPVPSIRAF